MSDAALLWGWREVCGTGGENHQFGRREGEKTGSMRVFVAARIYLEPGQSLNQARAGRVFGSRFPN